MFGHLIAASGIMAGQFAINVISNNIANINTPGFKGSTANFSTVYANTISSGSMPNGVIGGTNPKQVGNGVMLGGISTDYSAGGIQFTGRTSDLTIQGGGFYVVQRNDPNQGTGHTSSDFYLTRAGNFTLDANGNLVTAAGDRLMGSSQVSGNALDTQGLIQIPQEFVIVKDVDQNGTILATHIAAKGTSDADIADSAVIDPATSNPAEQVVSTVQLSSYAIGPDGSIAARYSNGDVITVRVNQASVDSNPNNPSQWRTELVLQTSQGTFAASNKTNTDQGYVDQIGLNSVFNGGVGASYSGNGLEGMQLKLQMASVSNPEGLLSVGNNNYILGPNAGTPSFGSAAFGAVGQVIGGAIESSNVDMASEFTKLMIAQRALQAASKAFKSQDECLQAVLQMV